MSYILFLLIYAFEASIRKYFITSTIIIIIKYIFLINIKFKKYIFDYSLVLLSLVIPLIFHALSKQPIPSLGLAIWDLMGLFLAPILVLGIFSNNKIKNYKLAQQFLYLIVLVGFSHSLLIIVQSISDPIAAINISVNREFTNLTFGDSTQSQGLLATPSSFLNISAILSIWYLRDYSGKSFFSKISYIFEIVILLSGFFILSARSYVIYSFIPYFIYLMMSFYQISIKLKVTKKVILFIGVFIFSLVIFINQVKNVENQNNILSGGLRRYQANYLFDRVISYYSGLQNFNIVPSLREAPGIGTTVGSSEDNSSKSLENIEACKEVGKEWDFRRMICISGFYGYFLIVFCRLIPAIFLINMFLSNYYKNKYKSASIGILIVSFLFFLQPQFNYNDTFAGILCIAITSNTINNIGEIQYKKNKKKLDLVKE